MRLLHLAVHLLLSGVSLALASLTLTTKPTNQSPSLGFTVKLRCAFSQAPWSVQWLFRRFDMDLPTPIMNCPRKQSGVVVCTRVSTFKNHTELQGLPDYSLRIDKVRRRNNGEYTCVGTLFEHSESAKASVTVQVAPGQPIVTSDVGSYREGQSVTLICASLGGNPRPSLIWYRQRRSGAPGAVSLPPGSTPRQDSLFGTTRNNITFLATPDDDQAVIHCAASNAVAAINSTGLHLKVKYKPRIRRFDHNPYRYVEGSDVYIPCNADGNPRPDASWKKASNNVSWSTSSSVLNLKKVTRDRAGIYTCVARNSEAAVERNLTLEIHYPPTILLARKTEVQEFNPVNLLCRVDAFPKAHVEWRRETHTTQRWDSSRLTIARITRTDAGRYVCKAWNTLKPSGEPLMNKRAENYTDLVVLYPPSQPTVEVSPGRTVVVSNPVTLTCSAHSTDPGEPKPTFTWTNQKTGEVVAHKSDFTIDRVSLANNAVYRCLAQNSQGKAPQVSVTLTVDERPQWLEPLLRPSLTVHVDQPDTLQIQCVVRGKPKPTVVWRRDDQVIPDTSDLFSQIATTSAVDVFSYRVVATLQWKGKARPGGGMGLRPEDNGNYSCRASNDKDSVVRKMELVVKYKPDFSRTARKVATSLGSVHARLVCEVSAQPGVMAIEWNFGGSVIISNSKYTIEYPTTNRKRVFMSVLVVKRVTEADLGRYRCGASNTQGSNAVEISLQKQSVPERPAAVRVVADTWESLGLEWKAPFDGGLPQKLSLQVSWLGKSIMKEMGPSIQRFNLSGLLPRTNYTLRLRGSNLMGHGAFSIPTRHLTANLFIPRISEIKLNSRTRTLTFSGEKGYCVRVEMSQDGGRRWSEYRRCLKPESESLRLTESVLAETFRAFLCLEKRKEVCSEPMVADTMENIPDIPTKTIIVVACVCAAVILVLVVVLLYFCCKRRHPRKSDFEANPAHRRPQAMTVQYPADPTLNDSNSLTTGKPYAMVPPSGYHDSPPATERQDSVSKPVFATSQSSKDPLRIDNHSVDLQMTPLTADGRTMSPTPNGDGTTKPRKVIYEVVV